MDFTMEISRAFGLSPFNVLEQDKDYVIMLINYYIEKSEYEQPKQERASIKEQPGAGRRVRVNEKTATGGWF